MQMAGATRNHFKRKENKHNKGVPIWWPTGRVKLMSLGDESSSLRGRPPCQLLTPRRPATKTQVQCQVHTSPIGHHAKFPPRPATLPMFHLDRSPHRYYQNHKESKTHTLLIRSSKCKKHKTVVPHHGPGTLTAHRCHQNQYSFFYAWAQWRLFVQLASEPKIKTAASNNNGLARMRSCHVCAPHGLAWQTRATPASHTW